MQVGLIQFPGARAKRDPTGVELGGEPERNELPRREPLEAGGNDRVAIE